MNIVAIGGGELKDRETLKIDRFVVGLTDKARPKALFIPTASKDAEGYCDTFDKIYGRVLGCRTDRLCLYTCPEDRKRICEKILGADLVYVGGGNTLRMMCLWRKLGVDKVLKEAGNKGTVLSGLSAGAICWHEWGHSDSRSFAGKSGWNFIKVRGLGFCNGVFCPHLDKEKRNRPFSDMVRRVGITGIACDNNAAVWYDGIKAIVKTSSRDVGVYVFLPGKAKVDIIKYGDGQVISGLK